MVKVMDLFPFKTYRKYQKSIIIESIRALMQGKVVIIRAPTGFGKSPVAIAILRYFSSGFYVTPQKILQYQLIKDFAEFLRLIQGKNNYKCEYDNDLSCESGLCVVDREHNCEVFCPYTIAKKLSIDFPYTLMNLAYFLLAGKHFKYPPDREDEESPRDVLVVDECQNIPNGLRSQLEFSIESTEPLSELNRIVNQEDYRSIMIIVERSLTQLKDEMDSIMDALSSAPKTNPDYISSLYKKYNTKSRRYDKAKFFLKDFEEHPRAWVYDIQVNTYHSKTRKWLKLYPVYVNRYSKGYLWSKAKHYVLMSASIIDPEGFMREIGLGDREYLLKDVKSTFPKGNRPIIFKPVGSMKYGPEERTTPKMAKEIVKIGNKYPTEKIIIHCHSYARADNLYQLCKVNGRCIIQTSGTRMESFNKWQSSKNMMFFSVAMTEGLDLVDDKCRVQILAKVPYPPIGDKVVAKRLKMGDWNWYFNTTLEVIIQAYGRAVRSKTDWADFYILDSAFEKLYRKYGSRLPKYITEVVTFHKPTFEEVTEEWK